MPRTSDPDPDFLERIIDRDAYASAPAGHTAINLALALAAGCAGKRTCLIGANGTRCGWPRTATVQAAMLEIGAACPVRARPLGRGGRAVAEETGCRGRAPSFRWAAGRRHRRRGPDFRRSSPTSYRRPPRVLSKSPSRAAGVRLRSCGHGRQRPHRLSIENFDAMAYTDNLAHRRSPVTLSTAVQARRRGQGDHPAGGFDTGVSNIRSPSTRSPGPRRDRDEPACARFPRVLQGRPAPVAKIAALWRSLSPRRDPDDALRYSGSFEPSRTTSWSRSPLDVEISARRRPADHPDEIGGRGHGIVRTFPESLRQGDPLSGDRPRRPRRRAGPAAARELVEAPQPRPIAFHVGRSFAAGRTWKVAATR